MSHSYLCQWVKNDSRACNKYNRTHLYFAALSPNTNSQYMHARAAVYKEALGKLIFYLRNIERDSLSL